MKRILTIISLCTFLVTPLLQAQETEPFDEKFNGINNDELIRAEGETATVFLNKYYPALPLVTTPIETNTWSPQATIIIGFFEDKENNESDNMIDGFLWSSKDQKEYKRIAIDRFEPDGSKATIENVFFEDIDQDAVSELIIVISWKDNQDRNYYKIHAYQRPQDGDESLKTIPEVTAFFGKQYKNNKEKKSNAEKAIAIENIRKKLKKFHKRK